jgi:hypothetical protein
VEVDCLDSKGYQPDRTILISDEVEAKVYSFSDYVSCIDLYRRGVCISSFCSDHRTIEEYLEEPETLLALLQNR